MRLINSIFLGSLVFVLVLSLVPCDAGEIIKTKVSVYMESLCPDCHAFIHIRLAPAFEKYSDYIQLDMVPFGNAKVIHHSNGSVEVDCQHGPQECVGNLYEACATNLLQETDPKKLMKYFDCLTVNVDRTDIKKTAKTCAESNEISFDTLSNCVDSNQGQDIILGYGERTRALQGRSGVPAVAFDDVFKPDEQDDIVFKFEKILCEKLKGAKPSDCNAV
ncbi:hypothetical protein WDU94_001819 [Cyamophila willieti]